MKNIRFYNDGINVENKRIILRLDLNVPVKNGFINDTTRIDLCLPFIKNLTDKKTKLIIISHLGRPKNEHDKSLSLRPIYEYLKKKVNTKIIFFSDKLNNESSNKLLNQKPGEIYIFENIRFQKGEMNNETEFSKNLASLCEIYINDAFSCSHRKQSSVHKITSFVKDCYAGPLFKKEIRAIEMVIQSKKKPVTCVIGGSKVSTKIGVISNLIKKVDNLVIVGAMANNFLLYKGCKVGKSLIEENSKSTIKKLYDLANENNCEIIIPLDCTVSESTSGKPFQIELDQIKENQIILDIGPKSINYISKKINESNTVLWNGPAGYFENKNFATGTIALAQSISENTSKKNLLSIVGGGDTVSAIKTYTSNLKFTHLSTAGGAFLEFLEGKNLPGIEVLK